ncbi:MAG: polysulfide reductase NrfD [Terracidiphilus sp.]|nr:polysulfide reductase NrfD [Terracidiphilus sp.]
MIEKALTGSKRYWYWVSLLLVCVATGAAMYMRQLSYGLGVTGMSREVSWGLYIGQFTFFVGVAASAVMVVIPYYLHDVKQFAKVAIVGELLAVASIVMCMLFILVDLGQPERVLNVLLFPAPHSVMFWDMVSLSGYLLLNAVVAYTTLSAEQRGVPAPVWLKPVVYLSIPWAVSIHTVTAFLYSGLAARPLWMTAVMAPRFLASAFAAGPALLILLVIVLKKFAGYDPGEAVIGKLATIVTYAASISTFLVLVEIFTGLYSGIPHDREGLSYQYGTLHGLWGMTAWMWVSSILMIGALVVLYIPALRRSRMALVVACGSVFVSLWMEKGLALIVGGFEPSPVGTFTAYRPTYTEWAIALGIWSLGALMLTMFYKITVTIRAAVQ